MKQQTKSKFLMILNTLLLLMLLAIPVYAFIWAPTNKGIDVELGTEDVLTIGAHGWLNDDGEKVLIPLEATATRADEVKLLTYKVTVNLEDENDLTVVATIENATSELLVAAENTKVKLENGVAEFTFEFRLNVAPTNDFDFNRKLQVTINFTLGE